jgi:heme A synthase
VLYHHPQRRELRRPAVLLLGLVFVQITLGAFVIWSGKDPVINTLHVVNGAAVLGTSLVLTLRSWRTAAEAQAVGVRMPRPNVHPPMRAEARP